MTRPPTQLGAPGPRPLGNPQNGAAPAGATSMTLGTLREVRNELASLGDLLERMSKEMAGLRRAVEAVASRDEAGLGGGGAPADAARAGRERALEERVAKLERRVGKLKRRIEWGA